MALGEICCIGISKNQRSSKTGFLFFVLLQMSLLSKVWTQATISPSSTGVSTDPGTSVSVSVSVATSLTSITSNSTSVSAAVNASSSDNSTALTCPAFSCTKDCYNQYMNATSNSCLSSQYCQIMKGDAGYSVGCSGSCVGSCGNGTLTNCSVNCCNTTNCLSNTLLTMFTSVNTTVATTTSTTTTTTTTTTVKTTLPTTPASNGKKCQSLKCNGAACYKTASSYVASCTVGLDYCMLQKTTSGTTESWQAGCSTDCRKTTVCSSTTTTVCYLECCNATTTSSCLKLTGDVNMPSSATRGPHCPALITASLLLFWIVKVFT